MWRGERQAYGVVDRPRISAQWPVVTQQAVPIPMPRNSIIHYHTALNESLNNDVQRSSVERQAERTCPREWRRL